jgi:hypothetical protein
MSVIFEPIKHKYTSSNDSENIEWTSVTSVVSKFKEKFDEAAIADKCSKNKKSKWYGLKPDEIIAIWRAESERSMATGTWYHNQRESDILEFSTITKKDVVLPIIKPIVKNGLKYAPEQKLSDGIYPEHFVYLKSAGICGQSDRVEVINGIVDIYDFKTNKEIKIDSYTSWDGIKKCMLEPLTHIPDANYWHYALQLSLYMYMILKHNPKLKPGKLILDHIIFKSEGEDQYGNKLYIYDENNNPIIEDIVHYELPYLKNEVIAVIKHLKK